MGLYGSTYAVVSDLFYSTAKGGGSVCVSGTELLVFEAQVAANYSPKVSAKSSSSCGEQWGEEAASELTGNLDWNRKSI